MSKRSYDEYCGLAVALDVLGERWTFLIIRELMLGPRRFTDLLDSLGGISTGLLTQRLRELESAQVIERALLPPPAASAIYQLTDDGETLRPTLLGLTRWGLRRLDAPAEGRPADVRLLAFAMAARFNSCRSSAIEGIYELTVEGTSFQFTIQDNAIDIREGRPFAPMARIETNMATLVFLNNGSLSIEEAIAGNALVADGDERAIAGLVDAFELQSPAI